MVFGHPPLRGRRCQGHEIPARGPWRPCGRPNGRRSHSMHDKMVQAMVQASPGRPEDSDAAIESFWRQKFVGGWLFCWSVGGPGESPGGRGESLGGPRGSREAPGARGVHKVNLFRSRGFVSLLSSIFVPSLKTSQNVNI